MVLGEGAEHGKRESILLSNAPYCPEKCMAWPTLVMPHISGQGKLGGTSRVCLSAKIHTGQGQSRARIASMVVALKGKVI